MTMNGATYRRRCWKRRSVRLTKVWALRQGGVSYAKIGQVLGISGERARQVLLHAGRALAQAEACHGVLQDGTYLW